MGSDLRAALMEEAHYSSTGTEMSLFAFVYECTIQAKTAQSCGYLKCQFKYSLIDLLNIYQVS